MGQGGIDGLEEILATSSTIAGFLREFLVGEGGFGCVVEEWCCGVVCGNV
jgi:hypothetical protein